MGNFEVNKTNRTEEFYEALERIKRDFISDKCKSKNPLFILAGGQPGSGKTAMIKTIKEDNSDRDFVVIDLDEFRKYHPDFETIKRCHKKDGVLLTNSFAFQIEDELLRYVMEKSLNTINLSTLRNTDLVLQNINGNIIPKGFSIKAYIMAVSPEESYLSSLIRLKEQQGNPDCITRFTSKEFHDEAYKGLNRTIRRIQNSGIQTIVCRRADTKDQPAVIEFDSKRDRCEEHMYSIIRTCRIKSRKKAEKEAEGYGQDFAHDEEYVQEAYRKLMNQIEEREI